MLSEDSLLSPLVTIESKIQSRVAEFLALKETIRKLGGSPSPIISNQAAALWAKQKMLEEELSGALSKIERLKQGAWTFSDISSLTAFYVKMETHSQEVEDLAKKASGVAPPTDSWTEWVPWALVLGVPAFFLVKHLISPRGR